MNRAQEVIKALTEAKHIPGTDLEKGDTVTVDMSKVDSKSKAAVQAEVKKGGGKVKVVGVVFGKILILAKMPPKLKSGELDKSSGPVVPVNALTKV